MKPPGEVQVIQLPTHTGLLQLYVYIYLACDILLNASGLMVPQLTELSYDTVQNIIYDSQFPTTVAQNTLTNITTSDEIHIWRSTTSELLSVIQSLLEHLCPAMLVLVENTDDVAVSLSSVLQDKLVLSYNVTVDVTIVQYNTIDNLTDKIQSALVNVSALSNADPLINGSSCALNQSQSGVIFILNSPDDDADAIFTTVSS